MQGQEIINAINEIKSEKYCSKAFNYAYRDEYVSTIENALKVLVAVAEEYVNYNTLLPIDQWCEDYGNCLFWRLPINEPPYCGTPLDSTWVDNDLDEYYTHFTVLTEPIGEENKLSW